MPRREREVHGWKLRALRLAAGADIRDFAAAVDYSWRHIQMIETWGRQPSPKLLRRLVAVLSDLHGRDIHPDELSTPVVELEVAA